MNLEESTFMLNDNSLGLIPTIAITLMFILTVFIYRQVFNKNKTTIYILAFEFHMLLLLIIFLIQVNLKSPQLVFICNRFLYATYATTSITSVYMISHLSGFSYTKYKRYTLLSTLLLLLLTYSNDSLILTPDVIFTTYFTTVKGPLMSVYFVYVTSLFLLFAIEFYKVYRDNQLKFNRVWPLYLGILFYIFNSFMMILFVLLNPMVKPPIYLNSILFSIFVFIHLFIQIKETLNKRENLYLNYIYDNLTHVHTRSYILDHLKHSLDNHFIINHFIAIINIDKFKSINDRYGHVFADELLKKFGHLLLELDPKHFHCGRLGGDEFIIVSDKYSSTAFEKKLNKLVKDYEKLMGQEIEDSHLHDYTISIGTLKLDHEISVKEVLTKVDLAMYHAKTDGRY